MWTCSKTGRHFSDKGAYLRHLKMLARNRLEERRIRSEGHAHIKASLRLASSFEEIEEWFLDPVNAEFLLSNAGTTVGNRPFRFVKMRFFDIRWSDLCPNTHFAPEGKFTNWYRDKEIPIWYPGWTAQLQFIIENATHFWTDIFRGTGINITGACGNFGPPLKPNQKDGLASCVLFAEDWPAMLVTDRLKASVF